MSEQTVEPTATRTRSVSLPADVPVEYRSAVVDGVDFERREITLIAVPYKPEQALVEHRGQTLLEEFEPGAFDGIESSSDHVTANRDHDYTRTVGKATAYDTRDSRGLVTVLKVSRTPLGDETLELAADGVLKASVGFMARRSDQVIRNGVRTIKRAFLDHIALVPNPAYKAASVLSVRQAQAPDHSEGQTAEGVSATPNLDAILALLNE